MIKNTNFNIKTDEKKVQKKQEEKIVDQKILCDHISEMIFTHHLYYINLEKILSSFSHTSFDTEIAKVSLALQKMYEKMVVELKTLDIGDCGENRHDVKQGM